MPRSKTAGGPGSYDAVDAEATQHRDPLLKMVWRILRVDDHERIASFARGPLQFVSELRKKRAANIRNNQTDRLAPARPHGLGIHVRRVAEVSAISRTRILRPR